MEQMKSWRAPAAWVVLAALTLRLLIAIGYGAADLSEYGSLRFVVPSRIWVVDTALVAVLGALVALCVLCQPIRGARALTVAALVVTGVATAVAAGVGVVSVAGPSGGLVQLPRLLSDLAVPGVVVAGLARMLALTPAAARRPAAIPGARDQGAVELGPTSLEPAPDEDTPTRQAPTWQPDEAQGTAWHRAGDAARGGAGSGWQADDSGGWNPVPGSPEQLPPAPRSDEPAPRSDQQEQRSPGG